MMDASTPQRFPVRGAVALACGALLAGWQPAACAADERLVLKMAYQLARPPVIVAAPRAMGATAPASMTLAQAYQLALENDATIRAARAAAAARSERLPQARSQLLPQVSASVSRYRNDLESTAAGLNGEPVISRERYTSSAQSLTVRQAIYRPAQNADFHQAQAQVREASAMLDREMQTLAVRVATAYLQVLSTRDQLALVMAQKRAFTTQLDAARKRFQGGAGTRTDVDEAQARLDMAAAHELEARQSLDYTRRQLQVLVDVPVGELAVPADGKLPLAPPMPDRVEEWTRRAEESSPEMRAAQAQVDAARRELDKARAGHLPTLDAVAQWSVSDSDNVTRVNTRYDHKSVGVQLNIPLFSGGLVSSQARQAAAELVRAQEALEAARRDLGLRVHKEFRAVSEGVLRVRALEQAVRSARTVVESSRRSFEAGARTVVDILNAEEQRATAERDLADARYVYLLSRVRLRALAGEADMALIEEASGWLQP